MSEKKPKIKLPSLSKVKRALYADWALRVKQRDGWKCLLCGSEENLTAHHWYCSDHHAHAARYCVDNGATLCYACHIRSVHTRADYVTVQKVANEVGKTACIRTSVIDLLVKTELTTAVLRSLWDAMRKRVLSLNHVIAIKKHGAKWFVYDGGPHQAVVVGNVIVLGPNQFAEVQVVAKDETGRLRYTVKEILL